MNAEHYASRLLRKREASRDAGDILARAAVQALKVNPSAALAAATFTYMKKDACVEAKFFAEMSAKERMLIALIRFLRAEPRGKVYR